MDILRNILLIGFSSSVFFGIALLMNVFITYIECKIKASYVKE